MVVMHTAHSKCGATAPSPSFSLVAGRLTLLAGVAAVAVALSAPAVAQVRGSTAPEQDPRREKGANVIKETNPDEQSRKGDEERVHDSYQPKGIDLGEFLFLPKVEVDESYTSNLYATQNNVRSDFVTVVRPELKLRSRFKEHALNITAMAEKYIHRQHPRENRVDGQLEMDGRYDFSSDTQANTYNQLYARHEDRGSPDDAGGIEPTPIRGFINRTSVKHQVGRYTALGEVGVDRRLFEAVQTSLGTTVPNQDRDRWELQAKARGSYEMFPGYAAVAELSTNTRRYDQKIDRNGFQRDSWGYRAEGGIGVDISQLVRGDFLVGYFAQNYEDTRLKDPRGVSVRAVFNWTPSTLTLIVPALERSVSETTTARASALVRTGATLTIRHELERNIVLTAYGSIAYDEMEGISNNNAWNYEARLRGTYAFTPEFFVGGEVGERIKKSQATNSGYNQTVVLVRLGLQL